MQHSHHNIISQYCNILHFCSWLVLPVAAFDAISPPRLNQPGKPKRRSLKLDLPCQVIPSRQKRNPPTVACPLRSPSPLQTTLNVTTLRTRPDMGFFLSKTSKIPCNEGIAVANYVVSLASSQAGYHGTLYFPDTTRRGQ